MIVSAHVGLVCCGKLRNLVADRRVDGFIYIFPYFGHVASWEILPRNLSRQGKLGNLAMVLGKLRNLTIKNS